MEIDDHTFKDMSYQEHLDLAIKLGIHIAERVTHEALKMKILQTRRK